MKLSDHVEHIRSLIYKAFNNQFSRLGVGANKLVEIEKIPTDLLSKRQKIEVLIDSHTGETGSYAEAREKALDELTFTLFNRLASIKVMEAHQLFPPMVTKEAEHGDRSFGHKMWLEQNPDMRSEELEGLREYFKHEFNQLGIAIPLFSKEYPYALLPYVIELNEIIYAFNAVEKDPQVKPTTNNQSQDTNTTQSPSTNNQSPNIWQSDDILGWLYESYNNVKKQAHKDSGDKTEYNKVSLQSQVYTPRWVVEFLVHNSLGKLYLEMYPDSEIKDDFKIANAPQKRIREPKPLHEIKLIDPASGSGNFLLYAFEFFYKLYQDQIDNFGADYDEDDIPKLIIENNLHGVDLDDRAIQLAQLGLWIKAKQKRRSTGSLKFNVVSSDFFLPEYTAVQHIFESDQSLSAPQKKLIQEVWTDLQQAYKFGSLVKVGEKVKLQVQSLYDKQKRGEMDLFLSAEITQYEAFEKEFFTNLETAVAQYATQQGNSFLTDKTKDAITFLRLITQRYDVATANPPYTDSADFGPDLKKFIEANYKKPYKFNTNLYATFIKRCFELLNEQGYFASISPLTFMYIKTFEDVRKFILSNSKIEVFAELGLGGVFLSHYVVVYSATYVLKKTIQAKGESLFLNFQAYHGKLNKKELFTSAFDNYLNGINDKHVYTINQSKLKTIKSYPFIYWISDEFREKFGSNPLGEKNKALTGLMTGNNNKFLRFWWEVNIKDISAHYPTDKNKWVLYQKGGPFVKWYGNNWTIVNYENNGRDLATTDNNNYYFKEGISYSASGSKGTSFRYIENKFSFDKGGPCIFAEEEKISTNYLIGFLNSKLSSYIVSCLNPTVNRQVGDLRRLPISYPSSSLRESIEDLAKINVSICKHMESFRIYNKEFKESVFKTFTKDFRSGIKLFLNGSNHVKCQVLINEAIINEKIFEVYELTEADRAMVLAKEGVSIGALPVSSAAKAAYLANEVAEFPLVNIREYIQNLSEQEFETSTREAIENEFPQLYQSNNDLEEFCIRHQINPINVWYWFKEANIIPKQRMNDLAMEFLADLLREILMEDDDGIIPIVPNAGEKVLLDRIEEKFMEKGFSMAQYSSFDSVLGRELNDYINNHFFKNFSDHLNLFRHLPATPFIWHLTSGPEQGFDCYIIIYKWNRDKLLSIRSRYIEQRERSLENRQSDLRAKSVLSASEQNELDKIYKQLKEIESFKQKIDELLAEGYNPVLDDGVGKNIAPLQKKKMIAYEVLNAVQLKNYLNADW